MESRSEALKNGPVDLYLCNRPVYFKQVEGDYISGFKIERNMPINKENADQVL